MNHDSALYYSTLLARICCAYILGSERLFDSQQLIQYGKMNTPSITEIAHANVSTRYVSRAFAYDAQRLTSKDHR